VTICRDARGEVEDTLFPGKHHSRFRASSMLFLPMIRPCSVCGKNNRIPAEHLADDGRCGNCKAPIPAIAEPLEVDASTFEEIVSGARVPVLIDFWAAWCGPCRMAAPEVKRTATEMAGRAVVLKVDTERWPQVAQRFNVMSIPNFVVMKSGRIVHQQPGLVDHGQMMTWLAQAGA
jgi:thioredoxin 2